MSGVKRVTAGRHTSVWWLLALVVVSDAARVPCPHDHTMATSAQQPQLSEADVPQLLQLLRAALSTDSASQKEAEAVLASLETKAGFCSCLAVGTTGGGDRLLHLAQRRHARVDLKSKERSDPVILVCAPYAAIHASCNITVLRS